MALRVKHNRTTEVLKRNLEKATNDYSNSIEKLSSGKAFTGRDFKSAERSISETMTKSIRSLRMGKNNASQAISLVQTADAGLNEIANSVLRLKELSLLALNSTTSDKERIYYLIEYEALINEINRVVKATKYNGIEILNGGGESFRQEDMDFFIGGVNQYVARFGGDDLNVIKLKDVKNINLSTENLGVRSAQYLIELGEGVNQDDIKDLVEPDDINYDTKLDEALEKIAGFRAAFGALNARLERVIDFIDVHEENLSAANSKITDVDVVEEIANLIKSKLLMQIGSSLMAHGDVDRNAVLSLISNT